MSKSKQLTMTDIQNTINDSLAQMASAAFVSWAAAPGGPAWNHRHLANAPIETSIGYVEAWRWWPLQRRTDDGPLFPFAENYDYAWSWSGENIASRPPRPDNTDGFYAYNDRGIEDHPECHLFGRVALYGDVVHHQYGYRAEKARILDVWVDKDSIKARPEIWGAIKHIPQVKGVYDTYDPTLYKPDGEKENYQCLILVTHKELSGTNLSVGQTTSVPPSAQSPLLTTLVIDRMSRNPLPLRVPFTYGVPTGMMTAPTEFGPSIIVPSHNKQWVVRPKGDVCEYCDRLIADDEQVVVAFEMPDEYRQKLNDGSFKLVEKKAHLSCVADTLRTDYYWGLDFGLSGASATNQTLFWSKSSAPTDPTVFPVYPNFTHLNLKGATI